jgi:hypothetical protein
MRRKVNISTLMVFRNQRRRSAYHHWCCLYFIVAFDILYQPIYGHVYLIWLVCLFQQYFSYIMVVLLMEEARGPGENHRPVASHWQTLSHNFVHHVLIEIRTHNKTNKLFVDTNKLSWYPVAMYSGGRKKVWNWY